MVRPPLLLHYKCQHDEKGRKALVLCLVGLQTTLGDNTWPGGVSHFCIALICFFELFQQLWFFKKFEWCINPSFLHHSATCSLFSISLFLSESNSEDFFFLSFCHYFNLFSSAHPVSVIYRELLFWATFYFRTILSSHLPWMLI